MAADEPKSPWDVDDDEPEEQDTLLERKSKPYIAAQPDPTIGEVDDEPEPDTLLVRKSSPRIPVPVVAEGSERPDSTRIVRKSTPRIPVAVPEEGSVRPDSTRIVRKSTPRLPVPASEDGSKPESTFVARKSTPRIPASMAGPARAADQPFSKTIAPRPGKPSPRESWTFQQLTEGPGMLADRVPLKSVLIAGRYEIVDRIGEGGMGEVYRVRHRQLGKPFALKLMQEDFSRDDFFRELFHREAQLASLLQHPNIVSVVDFGDDPEHGLFMVMELLDGVPLTERIKEYGRIPLAIVCDVMLQVADALDFSHSHHVVHADVKPDNILVINEPTSRGNEWSVKLLDFGMANLHSAERGEQEAVGGTPEFMAPERIAGQSPRPSMDIYSLGIIMHQLITGTVPFTGATIDEVFEAQRKVTPPRMSDVIGERIPERVELLVDRALAKQPGDRHPDMKAFIGELQAFMKLRGMRKRRTAEISRASRLVGGIGVARREKAAAIAYDDLPLPTGTVDDTGTITLANPALAYFLTGNSSEAAEGLNLFESKLPEFYPSLREDVTRVIDGAQRRSAVLVVEGEGGETERLRVIIRPTRGVARSCSLVIVPLLDEG